LQFIERVGLAGAFAAFLLWQLPEFWRIVEKNTRVTDEAVSTLKTMNSNLEEQTLELRMHRHVSESSGPPAPRRAGREREDEE
jgi:hypothetical protein